MNGLERGIGICALSEKDNAGDDIVVVKDVAVGAVNRLAELTEPDLGAFLNGGNVSDTERRAALGREDGPLNIGYRLHLADGSYVDFLQSGFDEAAAAVHVVVRQLLLNLAEREPVRDELVRIDADLILARRASEAGHSHDVGHGFELLLNRP